MLAPCGFQRRGAVVYFAAAVLSGWGGAAIEHHHFGSCLTQRSGGQIAIVAGGRDHHALARQNPEAVHIGAHRLAQHHAGQIVVRESQRAFDRPGGQHHFACADMPIALGEAIFRHLPGLHQFFRQADEIIIPQPAGAGPGQHAAACCPYFCGHGCGPCAPVVAFDLLRIAQQRWCQFGILFDQYHRLAATRRIARGDQACGARAHHQHIAESGAGGEVIWVNLSRRGPQPGGAADELFVEQPQLRRPEEGLVIEPRRQCLGNQLQRAAQIA